MLAIHPNARTTPAVRAEIARSAEPWLPLGADHPARSVAVLRADPASMRSTSPAAWLWAGTRAW